MIVNLTFGARRSGLTSEAVRYWNQESGPSLILFLDAHAQKLGGVKPGIEGDRTNLKAATSLGDTRGVDFLSGQGVKKLALLVVDDYFRLSWRQRRLLEEWIAAYKPAVVRLYGTPVRLYYRSDVKRIQAGRANGEKPPKVGAQELSHLDDADRERLSDQLDLWEDYITWPDLRVFRKNEDNPESGIEVPDPYTRGRRHEEARRRFLEHGDGFLSDEPVLPGVRPSHPAHPSSRVNAAPGFSFIRKTPFTWTKKP